MLNDKKIKELALSSDLITPYDERLLNPVSYDLTLCSEFRIPDPRIVGYFDMTNNSSWFTLEANQFVLGGTKEIVKIPDNLTGIVCGKSSKARTGISVEFAGLIDPGFEGNITLEIKNLICWPVSLRVGEPICQIMFFENDAPEIKKYQEVGHYNHQRGATLAWTK